MDMEIRADQRGQDDGGGKQEENGTEATKNEKDGVSEGDYGGKKAKKDKEDEKCVGVVTITSHTSEAGETVEVLDVGRPFYPSRSTPVGRASSSFYPFLFADHPEGSKHSVSAGHDNDHPSNGHRTTSNFDGIGFEPKDEECTEGHIDSLLQTAPTLEHRT